MGGKEKGRRDSESVAENKAMRLVATREVVRFLISLLVLTGLGNVTGRIIAQRAACPPFCDPISGPSSSQSTPPPHGMFRVTLNGFRVNNESDDDTREPWQRTGGLLTDRPPIVLWQGC